MFHTLFFSIAVLICVLLPVTFAQQPSRDRDSGAAAEHDEKLDRDSAKADAEQDARRNIHKFRWLGAGVAICVISVPICMLIGGIIGEIIAPSDGIFILPIEGGIVGIGIGLIVGILLPFIGIYCYAPDPPAQPLVEKSPEYVEVYTKAYQSKARWTRLTFAATGVGATLVGGVAILVLRSIF